jgi:N-formylglutamate amidohydrolase
MIPENLRDQIVLSDADLSAELTLMTDAFTDELFSLLLTTTIRFPISRLLVDVERFPDDADEPMSKVGMGMIYTLTAYGNKLKRTLQPHETRHLVSQYYEPHHQKLLTEVKNELEKYGKALIVDCHSFPSQPLPCDENQSIPRPEFCIGTDPFHTPRALIQATERSIEQMGYSVGINRPYAGSMVPMAFYEKDRRVASIMIEVNRSLYMDELAGTKTGRFDTIKEQIQALLGSIRESQQQAEPDVRGQWRGVVRKSQIE